MHERSWFPLILTGLSLALLGLILLVKKDDLVPQAPPTQEVIVPVKAVKIEDYEAAVNAILGSYEETKDARAAYDALIMLKVPAEKLSDHLDLVISFGQKIL